MTMSTVTTEPAVSLVVETNNGKSVVAEQAGHWPRVFTKEGVHPFDEIEWIRTDACIMDVKGNIKFEQKNIEVPAWWEKNNINVVASKYMRHINGTKEFSVKQIFSRVAKTLRNWAEEQGYFNSEMDAEIYEHELIYALLHQYGAFNSPVWFNLGVPNRPQAASACYISEIDDTLESIMDFQKSEAIIFSGGSGSGANFSKLRSSYEKLSTGAYVTGPLSWMRGSDQYAQAMKSAGSTRNAAKMVVLDMDHPDILETKDGRPGFIRCKAVEEKRAHALIQAGYSHEYDDPNGAYKNVQYQNANHSVSIPDEFMQAVVDDKEWHTRDRRTNEIIGTYRATDLWQEIAEAAWACADPGVQFSTTMNEWHTTPANGRIRASNPCSEFLHVDNTACNLCALNLTKFFDNKQFNYERFEQSVRLFVTAQNAIVAKASYPTDVITKQSHKLRPIGLNYGDLGSLVMGFGYSYDSDEGRAMAARMASLMTGLAYRTSARLSARIGSFSEFDANKSHMMKIMDRHKSADSDILGRWNLESDPLGDDVVSKSAKVWEETIRLGKKYGYTVSQASLQAPLGTISFLMGMNTTGIEPAFSLVSYKTLVGGGTMKLVNNAVCEGLKTLNYTNDQIDEICSHIEKNDTIEGAPGLKSEHLPVFDCAVAPTSDGRSLTPIAHITMMSAIQPLITCAISKTVNMAHESTVDDIANIYMDAWKLGIKCVAIYRDGSKGSQPLSASNVENKKSEVDKIHVPYRDRLPEEVFGSRHRFSVDGYKGYIQMNNYPDGRLGEVFVRLGKPGSTISGLVDSFTKLLSIALQYGVPLESLIESFADTRFEPAGITKNPKIRFAKSIYDYIFRHLDHKYFDGKVTGMNSSPEVESSPNTEISRSNSLPPKAERRHFDGPPCNSCGDMTVRNGSCYLCKSCGTTTGCS